MLPIYFVMLFQTRRKGGRLTDPLGSDVKTAVFRPMHRTPRRMTFYFIYNYTRRSILFIFLK